MLAALVHGCENAAVMQLHLAARGWNLAREEVTLVLEALHAAQLASPRY